MPGKTLDIETFFGASGISGPDHLAYIIAGRFNDWNSYRTEWLREKHELRNYLFATDTTSTSNSKLPWKNSTTVPKLTQIRDNLHANYMAALFPTQDWLRWEGDSDKDEEKSKRSAIENYIKTKLVQDRAEVTLSKLVLDYIDNGNCFATVEWVDESRTNEETGEVIQGYIGPRIIRVDAHDIVFNPLSSNFASTPKIVRTLKTLGELAAEIEELPETEYKSKLSKVLDKSSAIRRNAGNLEPSDSLISDGFTVDGFGSYQLYLQSDYVEILTFYGDLYDVETNTLKRGHTIQVVDRAFVVKDEPNDNWTVTDMFHHAGWRMRPKNLYAMGPLDNLVGMQYRIDHLENLKADVFDMIAYPMQKVRGVVEDYDYGPGNRIYVGDDGDVDFLHPDATALNAEIQIDVLERRMEQLAGAPREAIGIRSPGEKTAFEVQTLDNAASRLFLNKIKHFEKVFLEPLLNDMLAIARQNIQSSDVVRSVASDIDAVVFSTVTKDDITANGLLRPRGASHFAERANQIQNIVTLMNSAAFQDEAVKVHLSGKRLAKLLEELSDLDKFEIFSENIRVIEQGQTQQLLNSSQEQADVASITPPGISDADQQEV